MAYLSRYNRYEEAFDKLIRETLPTLTEADLAKLVNAIYKFVEDQATDIYGYFVGFEDD